MRIFLDTNFLIYCAKQNIDYMAEINRISVTDKEICILKQNIRELQFITKNNIRQIDRKNAELCLKLIKHNKIRIIKFKDEKYADEALLELERQGAVIATNDKKLKEQLRKKITIKGLKSLSFE
jgi:rRNA-processing protein FCF1